MYIGGRGLAAFVAYLVSPVGLFLAYGAKHIYFNVNVSVNDGVEYTSDALVDVQQVADGRIVPFQNLDFGRIGDPFEVTTLTALSQELTVAVKRDAHQEEWRFVLGLLESYTSTESRTEVGIEELRDGTTIRFKADETVFTVNEVSPVFFESFFRRFSYLHPGVRFIVNIGGARNEYYSENGVLALFHDVAGPYQLLHEPVHIVAHANSQAPDQGDLDMELVMAYHSWSGNEIRGFFNHGLPVYGGTHEQGVDRGVRLLKKRLDLPPNFENGVVAVASFRYNRRIQWIHARKGGIGHHELPTMISRLVASETVQWLSEHPAVEAQIRQLSTFQPPDIWTGRSLLTDGRTKPYSR